MIKTLSSVLFLLIGSLFALQAGAAGAPSTVTDVLDRYHQAKMIEMNVERTVKSDLLGRETVYQGQIFLAQGKFRWENKKPTETLLVFDGETIWSVQMPPKEFGGPVQVARGKVDKKNRSQILLSTLLGTEPFDRNFKILNSKNEGDLVKVEIAPQKDDLVIKSLYMALDPKKKVLNEISYVDDVGNLTVMKFSNIQFLKKEDAKLFKYQPPKGAQVSEL